MHIAIEKLRPNWTEFTPTENFHRDNVYLVDLATSPINHDSIITLERSDTYKNWPVNLFKKHPHPTVHIGAVYGLKGVALHNINEATNVLKSKYGSNCICIFELDEVSMYRQCCNNPSLLSEIFEKNIIMISDLMEPGLGRINSLKHMTNSVVHQTLKEKLPGGWADWVELFSKYNIQPKCIIANTVNSSNNNIEKNNFKKYNIHTLPYIPSFWYFTLCWKNNSKLITNNEFKQTVLKNIETSYNSNNRKTFVLPVNKIKPERLHFFSKLDKHNLLDKGDWSLFFSDPDRKIIKFFHTKEDLLFLEKYKEQLQKTIEAKTLGIDDNVIIHNRHSEETIDTFSPFAIKFDWLSKYKYYIVVETNINNNSYQLISEKTFKGFGAGLTMAFVSCADTVNEIKKLGFKTTFSDQLSYDHIQDSNQRTDKLIVEFLQRLDHNVNDYVSDACENLEHFTDTAELMNRMYAPFEYIHSIVNTNLHI